MNQQLTQQSKEETIHIIPLPYSQIINLSRIRNNTLTYDLNGNLIQDADNYYEYNGFNQLIRVRADDSSGNITAEYFYNHEGDRLKKIDYSGDGSNTTTYYIGDSFVQFVNSSGTFNQTYYYDNEKLVAENTSDSKLIYYHPDHLGSTSLISNSSGGEVEETFYLPFGGVAEGGDSRYTYTGKEEDSVGLMYYGARYYDTGTRHFTQADMLLPDIYDPQQLNRYSYVRNNPYKYVDPEGESIAIAFGIFILGRGALESVEAIISDVSSQLESTGDVDLSRVATQAGKGFVKGATIGAVEVGIAVGGAILVTPVISILVAGHIGEDIMDPLWDIDYEEKMFDDESKDPYFPEEPVMMPGDSSTDASSQRDSGQVEEDRGSLKAKIEEKEYVYIA